MEIFGTCGVVECVDLCLGGCAGGFCMVQVVERGACGGKGLYVFGVVFADCTTV